MLSPQFTPEFSAGVFALLQGESGANLLVVESDTSKFFDVVLPDLEASISPKV